MLPHEMSLLKSRLLFCLILCLFLHAPAVFAQEKFEKYTPKAPAVAPVKSHVFFAGEVRLLDGPFKESQDAEANYLLSLNVDRLLAPFLIESGLAAKAAIYPGWETEVLPGVGLSFYLSGISRLYMMTGKKEFLDRINYILSTLETCQQKNGGYLLGVKGGKEVLAKVEKQGYYPEFGFWGNGSATPYYSLEKLLAGLRDVYRICHEPRALQISARLGEWLAKHMSYISDTDLKKLMQVEYGGMNWILADLYADTGDKRFLAMSRRWQDTITVGPIIQGNDVVNGKHANMQFPKFSGLAARYPYTGNSADLSGAKYFWNAVVNHRTYATGGNSESEFFGPEDSLSTRLTPYTEENCNEYNMLRLTSLLSQIEPRVEYADYLERTLFNHILSAQNPADGKVCYFLPLMPGAERVYQSLFESFTCCVCSAMDSYTRHAEYIYGNTASAVYVHLFIASELDFKERGLHIKQETAFPDKDISTLTITCDKPVTTGLYIRNPYWTNNNTTLTINGKPLKTSSSKDGYFHINRAWQNNDVVEVILPMTLRTESMPDDKNLLALFYGPVLLAASLADKDADDLVAERLAPALVPGNLPLNEWLKPAAEKTTFTTAVLKTGQVEVSPFFRKKTGHYSVYWQKLSEDEWKQRLAQTNQKQEEKKAIDLRTIDRVVACDAETEAKHGLSGTSFTGNGNTGILSQQCWRASATGSFGYEMTVSDAAPNTLFCTFMGRKDYESWNCTITIDGKVIKTLQRGKNDYYPVNVWTAEYPVPAELTKGKNKIKVMFEPIDPGKMQMPRIIEMRILKQ